MTGLFVNIQADVEFVGRINAVASILEVVCRTTGMGFAAVARVTEERWVACAVRDEINFGLQPGGELKIETTLCNEVQQNRELVVINYVDEDEKYCRHPTPAMYGFQSYISVPIIRKDGSFFGTLCAIDPKPAQLLNPETTGMFKLFADLISFHLNAVEQLDISSSELNEERKTAELREQFIAILGHDLRNPVGAISNAAQLLLRMPLEERVLRLANIIKDSSYRIIGLIENILDFARGRLGEGITLNRNDNEPVEKILNQVIEELRVVWPARIITIQFNLTKPVNVDGRRIAQLFSNLLSNALSHGKTDLPITVRALSNEVEFELAVCNAGNKISDAVVAKLFQPFSRGEVEANQQGLGLGLYISSEIARSHGGTLNVVSTEEKTCFTLRIPQ